MKNLTKLNKQFILDTSLWKPPDKGFQWERPTNSWFDITQMNKSTQNKKLRLINSKTIRSFPIKLYPTDKQKNILLWWNEIYRQVYNITISYLKQNKCQSFISMRKIIDKKIQQNKNLTNLYTKWRIPKHTRDNAIKDCLKAYKTAFSNLRKKNIKFFRIRHKRKSCHLSSIVIEPSSFSKKKNGFAIKTLGEMKSKYLLNNISKECRLCYNSRTKTFLLRVPYDKKIFKFLKRNNVCSLDPGMRTFQTIYTPQGNCYEICSSRTNNQIKELNKKIIYKKKYDKVKYINRLKEKLVNKIKDLHWKTCNFLCKNFDIILIGNMSTRSIISKSKNLHKSTKNFCMGLSHYLFKQRLQSKCKEYQCRYEEVDESYTSKTCGNCGELNDNLGTNKTFTCDCSFKCDRDVNGARNILLKYLCSFKK